MNVVIRQMRLHRAYLLVMLLLALGCQTAQQPSSTTSPAAQRYAQVPPQQLEPSLTDENVEKMYTDLQRIPFIEVAAEEFANATSADRMTAPTEKCQVKVRQAYLRGRWLLNRGLNEDAASGLTQALNVDPNNAPLLTLLARADFQNSKIKATRKTCLKVLNLNPQAMVAHQLLGSSRLRKGELKQAASAYYKDVYGCL